MDHAHSHAAICTQVIDAIQDPLIVVDPSGRIVFYNRSAASALDLSSLENVDSLGVFNGSVEFQIEDVVGLLNRSNPESAGRSRRDPATRDFSENVYNYQLRDRDGNDIPVYVDIIHMLPKAERLQREGVRLAKHDSGAVFSPVLNPLSKKPGRRLLLDSAEKAFAPDDGNLTLIRFRDLSDVQRKETWRDELISMVSHDIRNPLSAIRNSVSLLLTDVPDPLTPVQQRFLETATRSIDRLTHLLDGVLDLSRIDYGVFKLNPSWVDLERFVTDVFSSFETLFNIKRVRLKLDISGDIDKIYVDTDRIEQVLFNLLSNALKFTPGGGEISLFVRQAGVENLDEEFRLLPWRDLPDPKFVIFTVRDTGLGMNEKTLANLFTRYYVDADEREGKGSHLGLNISKTLVEAHGGTLQVESKLGIGTEVMVTLPCDERTAYILGNVKSMKAHLDRSLTEKKRVTFYSIGKESGECWIDLVEAWPKQPVINPSLEEERRESFYMWTLSEFLAVVMVIDETNDRIGDLPGVESEMDRKSSRYQVSFFGDEGIVYENAARFDGFTTGVCLAPEEGKSFARLFNVSLKRMTKANRFKHRYELQG